MAVLVGAFHPARTMVASDSSTTQRTQATAIFFMAARLAFCLWGQLPAGLLIDRFGELVSSPLPVFALHSLDRRLLAHSQPDKVAPSSGKTARTVKSPSNGQLFSPWLILISTVSIATINFAPSCFSKGFSAGYAGVMSGVWMLGSAFGGLAGGIIADRRGNRPAIAISLLRCHCAPVPLHSAHLIWPGFHC